jgi:hypothetical protein
MDELQAHWRNKRLRCSICFWRGLWAEAEDAPRVQPAALDPAHKQLQDAMEEKEATSMRFGQPHLPFCPACGHHTIIINRSSIRPAM